MQPFWVSRAVPFLMVCVDDILRERQGEVVVDTGGTLSLLDDVAAVTGMLSHLEHLFRRQQSWLVQHAIRNTHFADVVQGRQVGQKFHALWSQEISVRWVDGEPLRQHACDALCPA